MPGTTSPLAETYKTYTAVGLKEALADFISRIDPEDTPFLSGIGTRSIPQTLFEWQTDTLRAAGANAQPQGFRAAPRAVSPTVRVGNYTQIMADSFSISGTLDQADKAGRRDEEAYQLTKVGAELKRDEEYTLLSSNQGGSAGSSGVAATMASMHAWIKTNVSKASDGVNPSWTSGVPTAGRTDGTEREASLAIINEVMLSCNQTGAKPTTLVVSPAMKQKITTFTSSAVAAPRFNQSGNNPTTIVSAVDVIVTDFGVLTVVPDQFSRTRDIWFVDFSAAQKGVFRPYQKKNLAVQGDSQEVMVLQESTLIVKNERAFGLAADLKLTA
jgi:hypothetical protein